MKAIFCTLGVLFTLCHTSIHAQDAAFKTAEPQQRLFDDLPSQQRVQLPNIDSLFSLPIGSEVHTLIAPGFLIKGVVTSRSEADQPFTTIVIKSSNRKGAALTLTKRVGPNGAQYTGRYLGFRYADALSIVQREGGYYLMKQNLRDLLTE